jgi:hypothetical protein
MGERAGVQRAEGRRLTTDDSEKKESVNERKSREWN